MSGIARRRKCRNDPDVFCYICGEYIMEKQRFNVQDFTKKAYKAYFGMKLGDQDKCWAPHMVCKQCTETLRLWTQRKVKSMRFGIPMVWREPKNHHDDCYFCMNVMSGWNQNKKKSWHYPNIDSALRPVAHCPEIPVPVFTSLPDLISDEAAMLDVVGDENDNNSSCSNCSDTDSSATSSQTQSKPKPFTQDQLNDLVRDLSLSKKASEVLASRLRDHNILESATKITFYRDREEMLVKFFSQEHNFVYCNNIEGLISSMGLLEYKPEEWRLFIDSSKKKFEMCTTSQRKQVSLCSNWPLRRFKGTLPKCKDGPEETILY